MANTQRPVTGRTPDAPLPHREDNPCERLAFEDLDLLKSDDLRGLRLQLEFLKPERQLRNERIKSTIVVFGSARLMPEGDARALCARLEESVRENSNDSVLARELAVARRRLAYSRYYDEAKRFAAIVSRRFQIEQRRDFVISTGGGPGAMEAANRGAHEADARSIGFNIRLPHEQAPNPFVSPELCFRFHYFALRKMHFLLRARALVAFPGGYGTLDEVFEVLTLVQTGKIERLPIVFVGAEFWRRAVDFDFLVSEGMVDQRDMELFSVVDSAEQAVDAVCDFYGGSPPD